MEVALRFLLAKYVVNLHRECSVPGKRFIYLLTYRILCISSALLHMCVVCLVLMST